MVQVGGSTCQVCTMTPGWEHTVIQHEMAESLKGPLLDYIRDDAFTSDRERVLTYTGVVNRFNVPTTARKIGRVLGVARWANGPVEFIPGVTTSPTASRGRRLGRLPRLAIVASDMHQWRAGGRR